MHQRKAEMAKHSDAFIALPDLWQANFRKDLYSLPSGSVFIDCLCFGSYSNSRKRSRTSDEEKGYKAICGPEDKKLLKFEGNEDYEDNLEEE
ncbi:uncharacterized protein [Phaseolus vulgaris]|uniref:uncharacterized protein isoform X2 n=1 Tax=Phaseolus vulgaris TaxID=3885 RepID=UPI0035CBFA61